MGYLVIIRPINCLMTFISVLVGAWVGKEIIFSPSVFLAGLIGFGVCAFGNIVNDLRDIEIDRINNPKRPLASGLITNKSAIIFSIVLFIMLLIFSLSLGILPFSLVAVALVLLIFYALFFKRMPSGNLLVALIAGLSFILGGLITKNYYCLIPFIFALLIHWAREIVKDVIDLEGDRASGIRSLPILLGEKRARYLGSFILSLLCLIIPVPFLLKILNLGYLVIVAIGDYPLIVYVIFCLLKDTEKLSKKELVQMNNLLKAAMGVGLAGFILG